MHSWTAKSSLSFLVYFLEGRSSARWNSAECFCSLEMLRIANKDISVGPVSLRAQVQEVQEELQKSCMCEQLSRVSQRTAGSGMRNGSTWRSLNLNIGIWLRREFLTWWDPAVVAQIQYDACSAPVSSGPSTFGSPKPFSSAAQEQGSHSSCSVGV